MLLASVEVLILSALILATRCANYRDVFIGGDIYFTDADCYARMTRARMCLDHPGTIVRHHGFENFPEGTTPHTTAPLDYLIVALTTVLRPVTRQALDLAGAIVSPLLGLITGWFLWWWSRWMGLAYRGTLLILFAASPILVHGTELGRPDHQSLVLGLITVALCAEWTLASTDTRGWSLISGAAWGLALWVSFYEPLVLLALLVIAPTGYSVEGELSRAALEAIGFKLAPGAFFRLGLFRADFRTGAPKDPTWICWVDAHGPRPDFHVAASFGEITLSTESP